MRKLLYLLLAVILLMFGLAYHASAQIVPAQNQQTTGPFGGIVLSTSTSPTAKLGQILGAAFGDILYWTGTRWQTAATSTLGISASPGGLNLQVQYNNGGVFGGISGAVTNGTILNLTNPLLGGATLTTSVVNGVTLTTAGSATAYLNGSGTYTVPASSGITTLGPVGQGQTGSTQTLATSTSVYKGLTSAITIVGSGNTQTFTPSLTGILSIDAGGTSATDASNAFANLSPLTTKGELITTTGLGNPVTLTVGTDETFLQASSTGTNRGLAYSKISLARSVIDRLPVANGGTGSSTLGSLLSGNGTSIYSSPTTTVSCTGSTTCSAFTVIGSAPVTINTTAGGSGTVTNIATTYPITGGPITTTGTLALAFGTTTSNTWAGTQTFTNSPIFSTVGAGTVNATAAGTIYNTSTSTPTVTAPITYSGTLGQFIGGISGTFACTNASAGVTGCLTGTDWSTFNGKQPAGNYITALTGDVAATGPGSVPATLATVNGNVGSFTNANITVNGKGLVTAASSGFGYPFPSNATTTVLTFTNGLTAGNTITFSGITGTANNCLQVNTTGVVSGTGSACGTGSGGANSKWASTTLPSNGISPNGGNNTAVGVGTSTPIGAQLVTSSSTAPQLGLTDGGSVGFGFRNAGGSLYIATTTGTGATTTMSSVLALNGLGAMIGIQADIPTDTTFFNFFIRDQNLAGPALTLGGNNGGDNNWIFRRFANNDGVANDRLSFGTGDQNATMAELMTILPTGQVGVGTTSPFAKLSVAMSSTTPSLSVSVAGSSTPSLFVSSANSNGYVGIGTANPGSPLVIDSSLNAGAAGTASAMLQGSANKERFEIDSFGAVNNQSPQFVGFGAGGTVASPTQTLQDHRLFALSGSGYDSTNTKVLPARAIIIMGAAANWTTTSQPTYITFNTTSASPSASFAEAMRIDSTGNVGIGTTTPWGKLSVAFPAITNYSAPLFTVATSSDTFGQLFQINATSTTLLAIASNWAESGVRTVIGGLSKMFANTGALDQLDVNGRINQDWGYVSCDLLTLTSNLTVVTPNVCGGAFFIPSIGAGSGPTVNASAASVDPGGQFVNFTEFSASGGGGTGIFIGSTNWLIAATSTPVLEVTSRLTTVTGTTTYAIIGFTNAGKTSVSLSAIPTAGCFFVASSTRPNWAAQCLTSATVMTIVDTGIASTTLIAGTGATYVFRVQLDNSKAEFFIRNQLNGGLTKVATITTTLPTTIALFPGSFVGGASSLNGGNIGLAFFGARFWWQRALPQS